ncbi:DUF4304 domain-containing protein [Synechococcus sp. RC10A2]|uniref:DUF4304 domain-containing protein n=1 Tax=Synechococcus sp. RC10A2 TaxID=2964529 RepID=UPI0039C602CD
MSLRSRFSRIVRKAVDPVLLPLGFTRRGQSYRRPLNRLWWVFQVERSRWNTAQECRFGIGGGILVPEVRNITYYHLPPMMPEKADVGDCIIRYAPEVELRRGWAIRQEDDAPLVDAQIIEELREYIGTKMVAFYRNFGCLDDVIAFLTYLRHHGSEMSHSPIDVAPSSNLIPLHLAVLYWLKGDQERACAYFEEMLQEVRTDWWREHLLRLKERLGCK